MFVFEMARRLCSPGVTSAVFLAICVVSVKGIPLPGDRPPTDAGDVNNRISTVVDDIMGRILEVGNDLPFPSNDSFNHHMACRSCKQLLVDVRFALLIEKSTITTYFKDPCNTIFTDNLDQHKCILIIEKRIGRIYRHVFQTLDQIRICRNYLHLCPDGEDEYAVTGDEIRNDVPE
ncbi:uncharacterized protein LOC589253 [Strongylocentrotus purpuratus]|uniref:Saposin B-type domain-containing protein n=1 Tax=Strongylocentrotus purpuratus TaxID=7668 RepID=A0A7M7RG43_STRPU|nr:uncharacterized protein LOC589253 [Strongylocentrotus purpuratus]|eukprot:XP_800548.3 PREDICTED: uncharacterized protein LOC589253 [Strongylocentrotus purpuratus]